MGDNSDIVFAMIITVGIVAIFAMGFYTGKGKGLENLELTLQELNRAHPMVIDYMMEESPSHDMKEWFYTIATPDDL